MRISATLHVEGEVVGFPFDGPAPEAGIAFRMDADGRPWLLYIDGFNVGRLLCWPQTTFMRPRSSWSGEIVALADSTELEVELYFAEPVP